MILQPTRLEGAWLIGPERHEDSRGFFARTWCREEFSAAGLDVEIAQQSMSHTDDRGMLRGLHFQRAPHQEVKLVRCLQGAIYDVIVDLRPLSPTYLKWQAFELTADNGDALYIPKGLAHGFQTLSANSQVGYQMSVPYAAEAAAGFRHDDPALAVQWPLPVASMSDRDRSWPDFPGPVLGRALPARRRSA
jgi:dTDP-4-dehydrorhamnose 3,5-epimerase